MIIDLLQFIDPFVLIFCNSCFFSFIGSVGISVAGQDIFPAFNNLAYLAPQKCEVDPCNEVRNSYLA